MNAPRPCKAERVGGAGSRAKTKMIFHKQRELPMKHSATNQTSHANLSHGHDAPATSGLYKNDMLNNQRGEVTIIVMPERKFFHFCGAGLQGVGNDAWYPYSEGQLFQAVERFLVTAKIANNVVAVDRPRRNGTSCDYRVVYNKYI
jgi:hypothetical protein